MKIQMIELKEVEIFEGEEGFEQRFINVKKYPAFLTNASIKRGYDLGLLESSLFEDLLKLKGLESVINATDADEDMALGIMGSFDDQKLNAVIYLAVIGANRKLEMSFDDFLELYHLPIVETIELYVNIITSFISGNNDFAKALTSGSKSKKKQAQKHRN